MIFQKMHKEKAKKAVCVWTCCELLRMYFKLGQVNQCPFLIAALTQPYREGFTLTDLPRPIAVTMSFYWGKHCVFDHKLRTRRRSSPTRSSSSEGRRRTGAWCWSTSS